MEDIIQRVFAVIFSVVVFFIMPLYMTFEKKDDISYALALKITYNFVNSIKAKGYLTADMYTDFTSELSATGNVYEVKLEHIARNYNPVINVYDSEGKLADTLDYTIYKDDYEASINNDKYIIKTSGFDGAVEYSKSKGYTFDLTYKLSEIIYTEKQILDYLSQTEIEDRNYLSLSETDYKNIEDVSKIPYKPLLYQDKDKNPIYAMAIGDEFGVIIRNTNTTIAAVLFDALTFNGIASSLPRVYINYGCTIKNEEFRELVNQAI